MSTVTKTKWHMTGEELVTCNCAWGCPCQFNATPTRGNCDGMLNIRVENGQYGNVKLDGMKFAAIVRFPGALHEGNGTVQVVIDSATTPDQMNALGAILSGKEGGTFFEIIAAICPNVLAPIVAPITFQSDRKTRTASVNIPGIAESSVEPIKNPVTGEEHQARIVLPTGFEYKEAEMGNTLRFKVTKSLPMEYTNCYAQLNRFEWGNA